MAVCHASSALAVLAVTPLLLTGLGLQMYGVWALLATFIRYSSGVDLGFGPSVTKYVATYAASEERLRVRQVITFATLAYFVIGAVIFVPVQLLAFPIAHALHTPPSLDGHIQILAFGFSYTIFAILVSGGLSSALIGLGRLGIASAISGAGQLTFAVAAAIGMLGHFGLPSLCLALCVQYTLVLIANIVILSRSLNGSPFVAPWNLELLVVKRMFAFGGWVTVSTIMVLINAETDVVIIAAIVGLSAAGVFDLGNRLARLVRVISYYTNAAVMPSLSRLEVEFGSASVRALFLTSSRAMSIVSIIGFCALAGMTPTVLRLWLGNAAPRMELVLPVVLLLGLGYAADNIASVASTILRAIGRPRFETLYQVMSAGIHIVLTLLLAWRFGIVGVVVGTMSGALVSSIIYLRLVGKDFVVAQSRLIAPWLSPLAVIGTMAALAAFAAGNVAPHNASRPLAAMILIAQSVIYLAIVAAGFRLARLLEPSDMDRLRSAVPAPVLSLVTRVRKAVAA